ncbi:MAG: Asp-tRNA(Asn)/Glu-tRNA(Gln) amidotransferase subunit GatA [Myxococcaceae bacterium]|nr:Asp-tRNA(Asn)/Glu-tRNA(Gln) amidotransferase subunit GatA [Myxococcaceae bacterium]
MKTLAQAAAALASGQTTSEALTSDCLRRAKADPFKAFLALDETNALAAAKASDTRRREGRALGALDGIPVSLKDNILTEGLATTAGSRMLEGFRPPYDATVTARLKAAGAVVLGKTNLDEFGMGSSTENSAFHETRNPLDPARTPGGSSGGSAASVAAGLCFGSLGTDTGGSIRQPAAFTGLVGLKPSWGRVSRFGVVAYASSLDQVGPLAHTVEDAATLLSVIEGVDAADATSSSAPKTDLSSLRAGVKGLRVGLPKEFFVEGMDPEVASSVRAAAETLRSLGATVEEVSLPHTRYALATYYVIAPCEASSNLGRYDGVRFGHRTNDARSLKALYENSRAEGFGPEVKRRIMLGTFALSAGYADAYYRKAQQVRALIRRDYEQVFQRVDVVLSATSPVLPWRLGEKLDDPLAMYLMDVLTLPCNLAGLPGLSLPCGRASNGLPIGAQLLGRPFDEATVLKAAYALETALGLQFAATGGASTHAAR